MALDLNFLYPSSDDGPITFFANNALGIVKKYQVDWFKWQNYKWSNLLKCTLNKLEDPQLILGFPINANSRALYAFPLADQQYPDNFDKITMQIGLLYATGKTQPAGQAANQYGDLQEAGFYLHAFNSLFKKISEQHLATAEFTAGWPEYNPYYNTDGDVELQVPSEPPNVVVKTTLMQPDRNMAGQLQQLGLQAYLQLDLIVDFYDIKRPS